METKDLISIQQFCSHYNIPVAFLSSLNEFELIEIVTTQNKQFIHKTHLRKVEKMIRLHYELDINLEGVDAVYKLLKRVESLQDEITVLRNKLNFLEGN